LQGGHCLDGVGLPNGVYPGLGETEVADLSLVDQLLDRAGHVLDRHVGIDPVLVKKVDVVGAQPAQRALEHFADVFGPAV